jgi:hypothetical protein
MFLYAQNRNSMWLCVGVHNVKIGKNGCQFCVFLTWCALNGYAKE